jgi:hypothetical protein
MIRDDSSNAGPRVQQASVNGIHRYALLESPGNVVQNKAEERLCYTLSPRYLFVVYCDFVQQVTAEVSQGHYQFEVDRMSHTSEVNAAVQADSPSHVKCTNVYAVKRALILIQILDVIAIETYKGLSSIVHEECRGRPSSGI